MLDPIHPSPLFSLPIFLETTSTLSSILSCFSKDKRRRSVNRPSWLGDDGPIGDRGVSETKIGIENKNPLLDTLKKNVFLFRLYTEKNKLSYLSIDPRKKWFNYFSLFISRKAKVLTSNTIFTFSNGYAKIIHLFRGQIKNTFKGWKRLDLREKKKNK